MRYIFHCEPEDFILAGKAIRSALKNTEKLIGVEFSDGSLFSVTKNKNSVTVRKHNAPKETTPTT